MKRRTALILTTLIVTALALYWLISAHSSRRPVFTWVLVPAFIVVATLVVHFLGDRRNPRR